MHTLLAHPGTRLVIVVDEDVDIYSMDDVMWAIMTRANPTTGLLTKAPGMIGGGLAIDATAPFPQKERFERVHYAVEKIDLKKWFSEAEINAIKAQQGEYASLIAKRGG